MQKLLKRCLICIFCLNVLFFADEITCSAKELPEETILEKHSLPDDLSIERQRILLTALSLEGQIPYEWGGKPKSDGWNERWNKTNGLDCSGFVQWVYWTSIGIDNGLESTGVISNNCNQIKREEILPGDIGIIYLGPSTETRTNHVGIYMGNNKWIHCSGDDNTVVVSENLKYFHYYLRVDFKETTAEEYEAMLLEAQNRIDKIDKMSKEVQIIEEAKKEADRLEEEIKKLIIENQKHYFSMKQQSQTVFGIEIKRIITDVSIEESQ